MSRLRHQWLPPNWGRLLAYTSDTQLALSVNVSEDCDFPPLKDESAPTVASSVEHS